MDPLKGGAGPSGSGPTHDGGARIQQDVADGGSKKSEISSTQALVDAFNAAKTKEEINVLQEWLRNYVDWFHGEMGRGSVPPDVHLEEYSLLATIQPVTNKGKSMEGKDILLKYFDGLCRNIHKEYMPGEEPLMEALENTLQVIDKKVFGKKTMPLTELGRKLLEKIDSTTHIYAESTFQELRCGLHSLHLVLQVLGEIAPKEWDPTRGLHKQFKDTVQGIVKNAAGCYPLCYHARLVEQSLGRLGTVSGRARFQDCCRRLGQGTKGALAFWKGATSIATLEISKFNIKAVQSGYEDMKSAFRNPFIKVGAWYDQHQAMHNACMASLTDPAQHQAFQEKLEEVRKEKPTLGKAADWKAIRFGLVQQLTLLTLKGATADIRKTSMEELATLAESRWTSTWKCWLHDKDVLKQLLECLATIAVHSPGDEKKTAEVALMVLSYGCPGNSSGWLSWLQDWLQSGMQATIDEWLGDQSVLQKLDSLVGVGEGADERSLFRTVKRPIPDLAQEAHQALKEHYQTTEFAMVNPLFKGYDPKPVDSLQCQLMLVEHVKVKEGAEGGGYTMHASAQSEWTDDLTAHEQHLKRVKTPISLKELFNKRSTKPGEPEQEINKVLLVGNPGTGKTTLSQKVAYDWAKEEWGREFQAVYVVPVRTLQKSKYDDASTKRNRTLATAIANESCPLQNKDEEYVRWRDQISKDLERATTLVVLDGLDESYGADHRLVNQAMLGKHKVLMLSRPYGVTKEREMADIEVEHVGLNDKQMEAFILKELKTDLGQELLTFIKGSPGICAIAHVPVNLQILCTLWQENAKDVRKDIVHGSLTGLYKRITWWTWQRYMDKDAEHKFNDQNREVLFAALGWLALKGLQGGVLQFGRDVMKEAVARWGYVLQTMLEDSGFLLLQNLGGFQWQFPHLTFQEYFGGRHLAMLWVSKQVKEQDRVKEWVSRQVDEQDSVKEWVSGQVDEQDPLKWVADNKYDGRYRVTLRFMAGVVAQLQGFQGIQGLLRFMEAPPREVLGFQHSVLHIQLLHEGACAAGGEGVEWDNENIVAELEGAMEHQGEWVKSRWDGMEVKRALMNGLYGAWKTVSHAPNLINSIFDAWLSGPFRDGLEDWLMWQSFFRALIKVAPYRIGLMLAEAKDTGGKYQRRALVALGNMALVTSGDASILVETVVDVLLNDPALSNIACRALKNLVELAPEQAPVLVKPMLNACKEPNMAISRCAFELLEKVVEFAPEQAPVLMEPMLSACEDGHIWAVTVLEKIAEFASELAPKLVGPMLSACKDGDIWAVVVLKKIAEFAPELAPKLVGPMLSACKDGHIWAVVVLEKIAEFAPELAPDFVGPMLDAWKGPNWGIRRHAFKVLKKIDNVAPGQSPALVQSMLAIAYDSSFEDCDAAFEVIGNVVEIAPGQAPALMEHMLTLVHREGFACYGAIDTLGKIVKLAPGQAPALVEPMLTVLERSKGFARSAVIYALGKIGEFAPEQGPALVETIVKLCVDPTWGIDDTAEAATQASGLEDPNEVLDSTWDPRDIAIKVLGKIAELPPMYASGLVEPMVNALSNPNSNAHDAAIEVIGKIVECAPQEAPPLMNKMVTACMDPDPSVHGPAFKILGKIAELVPGQAPAVVEVMMSACKAATAEHDDRLLPILRMISEPMIKAVPGQVTSIMDLLVSALKRRKDVFEASKGAWEGPRKDVFEALKGGIAKIVKAKRGQAQVVVTALVDALAGLNREYRWRVVDIIKEIVELTPERAPVLLELLVNAWIIPLGSSWGNHSSNIAHALEGFSCKDLMEAYWASQHVACIDAILPKLVNTILTVEDSLRKQHHKRVVLHIAPGQPVKWTQPDSKVQQLLDRVQQPATRYLQ